MSKIIVISGPTASGKSNLALEVAKNNNGTIINADSLQIYRELPILSSQPNNEELNAVDHYLYSELDFHNQCSVMLWLEMTKKYVDISIEKNKLPIIVGGTGMYISKLFEGISYIPEISKKNKEIARKKITDEKIFGIDKLKNNILTEVDLNEDEKKIFLNYDERRLSRFYEIYLETGKTIFYWHKQKKINFFNNYEIHHLNLNPNRDELYDKCNKRFKLMMKNGAIEEVQILQNILQNQSLDYNSENLTITKTIGFREICNFLDNTITYEEAIELATKNTRNYAKRQITWFSHQFKNNIIKFSNTAEALNYIKYNF